MTAEMQNSEMLLRPQLKRGNDEFLLVQTHWVLWCGFFVVACLLVCFFISPAEFRSLDATMPDSLMGFDRW